MPFELIVYGPHSQPLKDRVKEYKLEDIIHFKGEVLQNELSIELRNSDSLILYSRFETFGCVVIEAFASGVPVIVSNIPVMQEIVQENFTGIFAELEKS